MENSELNWTDTILVIFYHPLPTNDVENAEEKNKWSSSTIFQSTSIAQCTHYGRKEKTDDRWNAPNEWNLVIVNSKFEQHWRHKCCESSIGEFYTHHSHRYSYKLAYRFSSVIKNSEKKLNGFQKYIKKEIWSANW